MATATPDQERMCSMRASGLTLQQIGDEYGISRERVRQICEREGVIPKAMCRRCGEMFPKRTFQAAAVCPACRERRCTICGEPFTRNQWLADDGDAHPSCRREIRGASGGTTLRAVEKGIYQRVYKSTEIPLSGYVVFHGKTYHRYPNITQARKARKEVLAQRAARE